MGQKFWGLPMLKIFHRSGEMAGRLQFRLVAVLLAASFFTILPGISAAEKLPPPQVILLNSYHPGYTWSDNELAGALQELRRVYPKIDLAIEYLDTKRFPSDAHLLRVKDYLANKYRGHKFDLVIALDNPALMMILNHRTELFPNAPIVFAGINDFQPAMLAGQEKVTGEAEILDIEGTLKSALGLHPETTKIYVVTDYTMSGKSAKQDIEDIRSRLPADVDIEFAPPATMGEVVDRIKKLPPTAIIFIVGFVTDKAGQTFSMAEGTRRLTQEAKVPVYIVHEGRLGHGPVGGMLLEGEVHGRQAGKIALRVLAGADPSNIPVQTKSTARPMFDYHQLERFKIPSGALSPGSIIINRPSSFYEVHQSLVWGASGVVLVLGVVVLILGVNITRRRRAEKKLEHHLDFLQNLLDTIPNPVFYKDFSGVYLECNKALEDFLGLPKEGIVGKSVFDIYPKDLADKYYAMDQELFHHPGTQVYEFEMEKPDGTRRKFIFNKATFPNADGSLGGLIGVMTDITERKEAEAALRQANETLRATLDAAPVAIFDLDTEGRVKSLWNPAAEQMLGWPRDEVLGKFLPSVPQESEVEFAHFREWVRSGKLIMGTDVVRRRKDGSRIEYSIYAAPEYDDRGQVIGNIAVLMDITERRRAEAAIKLNEARLASLLRISQYQAESIQDLLNYSLEEVIALTASKLGCIYFYDDSTQQLTLNAWSREMMQEDAFAEPQIIYQLKDTGILAEVVRQARPIMVNDFHAPHPLKECCLSGQALSDKFLTIPVRSDNRIVAVVGVANKATDYDEADVRQLTLMMDAV